MDEASEVDAVTEVKCAFCGTGMTNEVVRKYDRSIAYATLVMGIVFIVLFSPLVGLAMAVVGIYLVTTSTPVWLCSGCGAMITCCNPSKEKSA